MTRWCAVPADRSTAGPVAWGADADRLLRGRADFHAPGWAGWSTPTLPARSSTRPAYLKLYWEEFGETPEHLLLAFAEEDDGTQVGAVAFERIGETLRFLGGTEVTDYMGPVGAARAAGAIAKELWAACSPGRTGPTPTCAVCPRITLARAAPRRRRRARHCAVEETDDQNGVAPFLPLPRRGTATSRTLPSKLRHEIKRKARKLTEEAGPYRIVTATERP